MSDKKIPVTEEAEPDGQKKDGLTRSLAVY